MIHIHAGQTIPDGLVNQCRCHRGIHAAGQCQQHGSLLAYGFPDAGNGRLGIGRHGPVPYAAADMQEVADNRPPLIGVGHFRVELHAVDVPHIIRHGGDGAILRVSNGMEAFRANLHLISVAHPVAGRIGHILQDGSLVVHGDGNSAVLPLFGSFYLAP